MNIQLTRRRIIQFSKTSEYIFSIDEIDHQLIIFESSQTGIEYWLNGIQIESKDKISENITLDSILQTFEN